MEQQTAKLTARCLAALGMTDKGGSWPGFARPCHPPALRDWWQEHGPYGPCHTAGRGEGAAAHGEMPRLRSA